MLITLAIETSQRIGGVALHAHGRMLVEPLTGNPPHDQALMPAVDRLVRDAGCSPRDLQLVGVSIGPGGFTGLRIAIATAKMFAETLSVTLVGVPSALVAAESTVPAESAPNGDLVVASAVKRDQAWLTRLTPESGDGGARQWTITATHGLCTAEQFDLSGVHTLLGDSYLPTAFRGRCEMYGVQVVEPAFNPASCAVLAESMVAAGHTTEGAQLLPIYAREPEAVRLHRARRPASPGQ